MKWMLFFAVFPGRETSLTVCYCFLGLRFGRRNAILVSYILTTVFGFASAFAHSYITFAVLRFFTGVSITGISIISLILGKFTAAGFSLDRALVKAKTLLLSILCEKLAKNAKNYCNFPSLRQSWSGWMLPAGLGLWPLAACRGSVATCYWLVAPG